jgi:uncharacterized protein (TIGR03032 family)
MTRPGKRTVFAGDWARSDAEWRDPAQVVTQWSHAGAIDPRMFTFRTRGDWWDILESAGVTLLVSREYEHLLMALRAGATGPVLTYLPLPHPSGLAIDKKRRVVYLASTRNPNQIMDLTPARGVKNDRPLVPVRARFLPGRLYLHDLAVIDGRLYATAVGENSIVEILDDGRRKRVWWPKAIEGRNGPRFDLNYLQLNSIAAGTNLVNSFFTASTDRISVRRPGHQNFSVDKRGVIFSGATREPIVTGLTRPHSARLYRRRLWVDNSGYGELCVISGNRFDTVARLPGWTRGLCFNKSIAFVGTSRVIPRFKQYAPGLNVEKSECGVHAVEIRTGKVLGSLIWPAGNQIFSVDWIDNTFASGLPYPAAKGKASLAEAQELFYGFQTEN